MIFEQIIAFINRYFAILKAFFVSNLFLVRPQKFVVDTGPSKDPEMFWYHSTKYVTIWQDFQALVQRVYHSEKLGMIASLQNFSISGHHATIYRIALVLWLTIIAFGTLSLLSIFPVARSLRSAARRRISSVHNNETTKSSSKMDYLTEFKTGFEKAYGTLPLYTGPKEFKIGDTVYFITVMAAPDPNDKTISVILSCTDATKPQVFQTSFFCDKTNSAKCSLPPATVSSSTPKLVKCGSSVIPLKSGYNSKDGENGASIPPILREYDALKARYGPSKADKKPESVDASGHQMQRWNQITTRELTELRAEFTELKLEWEEMLQGDLNRIHGARLNRQYHDLQRRFDLLKESKDAEINDLADTIKTLVTVRKSEGRDAEIRALNGIIETLLTNI